MGDPGGKMEVMKAAFDKDIGRISALCNSALHCQ